MVDKDFSKCQCPKAGWCNLFQKEMTANPPNWQWCKGLTEKERKEYHEKTSSKFRTIRKAVKASSVDVINFVDDIPTPKSDYAVCVIPSNQSAMGLLDVTRESIESYAKKCGADYIELTGDQNPDWPMANKYRLHKVASTYKKTLYLDCDVVVKDDAPNIFLKTPNDKLSAFDELSIWEKKEDSGWITQQQDHIVRKILDKKTASRHLRNGKFTLKRMINGGVMVIPQSLADYYVQPDKEYPRHWCFDQNYLTLTLPEDKFHNLDMKWNTPFVLGQDFHEASLEAYFVHVNNNMKDHEMPQRKRLLSSFLPKPKDKTLKVNTCLLEGFTSHRSGWNYAISKLISDHHSPDGIVIDDFIERSHSWHYEQFRKKGIIPYKHDWVGFVHNPMVIPSWFNGEHSAGSIFDREAMQESFKTCKGLFTFSKTNADIIRSYIGHLYDFPILHLLHPTELCDVTWSPSLFKSSERKIILLGYWLRKITYFTLLKTDYKKIWLRGVKETAEVCWYREKAFYQWNHWRDCDFEMQDFLDVYGFPAYSREDGPYEDSFNGRNKTFLKPQNLNTPIDNLEVPDWIPNEEYDELLSSSIVFLNFYDTVANNAVIECIARNTPIVVYKHPSVVEYLGKDYPCYFTNKKEAERIIHDDDLILEAHEYLKNMNKDWLSVDYFTQDLMRKLNDITK